MLLRSVHSVEGEWECVKDCRNCYAPGMVAKTPQARPSKRLDEIIMLSLPGKALEEEEVAAPRSCSGQPARAPKKNNNLKDEVVIKITA
jgi:hypothetical protein